ncbi:ABC transporter substrate-binding protein [Gulosibacter sp. 10]|uniref:ABC transporter substrate-binding protein n=1 Tax=Gulosibacter sp. 10 TaxID=1255570 RepID=UPI000B35A8A2|nr:ABC transporter substrate-binding protein [Gulosibacter sp. 10]
MTAPRSATPRRRRRLLAAVAAVSALALSGCAAGASEGEDGLTTIRFALDWTPNTNHTGLYVAMSEGYFAEAGIEVEIVPYNNSSADVLVDSGRAEFGIGFQDSTSVTMAAGADLVSVLAVQQTWTTEVSVLADRDDIQGLDDLDGLVYGGFGTPAEEAIMRGVIERAGGEGEFETVVLGTTAYEALYNGDVDFTVPFVAWEGIEAEHRGVELKNFAYTDYGFPDNYQVIITGNGTWLDENPELASGFVQAIARGYEDAIEDPAGAAEILQQENSDVLTDLDFLIESQEMLSEEFMLDEQGEFGLQTEEQWSELGAFLYEHDLLADGEGAPLEEEPDWSSLFTNEYLGE